MPIVSKQIDLDELKDLRSEMSIDDLACHFSVGRMTIIRRLKKLDMVKSTGSRPARHFTYDGETKSLLAWSQDERCMVSRKTLQNRVDDGWDFAEALTKSKQSPPGRTSGFTATNKGLSVRPELNDSKFLEGKSLPQVQSELGCSWAAAKRAFEKFDIEPEESRRIVHGFGESKRLIDWSRDGRCKVSYGLLAERVVRRGWVVERALVEDPNDAGSSEQERQLYEYVLSLCEDSESRTRIDGCEVDIYVPSKRIAIEYNGLYWHSHLFKKIDYHHQKWRKCNEMGIRLIQIWEDDWLSRRDIVKSMIAHKLGVSTAPTIGGSRCIVDEIEPWEARIFLFKNHIQGFTGSSVCLGLREKKTKELVALASFLRQAEGWELVRYATSCKVPGGLARLIKAFRETNDGQISTFADLCVSDGDVYGKLGFELVKVLQPNYWVVWKDERWHKSNFYKERFSTDDRLHYDPSMTKMQLYKLNNLRLVYDAGKYKFVLP